MIVRLLAARISRLIFPVVLQFFSLQLSAQAYIGLREIINYEKQQYSAGTQNWDIRQDAMGIVYFANNEGLLSFDGTYWKLYPLPNKTIVRSIEFGKDKRIYIGAQDEIGYFSPDESGKLVYTSLKNLLPEPDQKFADIWNLVSYGDDIFFRSNNKIFRYRDNRMTVYKPATAWMFAGQANDQLLAQDEQKGLVVFKNDNWETLIEKSLLPAGFGITSISSFNKDSCLITTHKNGLYVLSGNKLHPFRLSGMQIDPRQNFSVAASIDEESFMDFILLIRRVLLLKISQRKKACKTAMSGAFSATVTIISGWALTVASISLLLIMPSNILTLQLLMTAQGMPLLSIKTIFILVCQTVFINCPLGIVRI